MKTADETKQIIPTYPLVMAKLTDDAFEKTLNMQTLLRKYLDGKYYLIPCRTIFPMGEEVTQQGISNCIQTFHEMMYKTLISFKITEETKGGIIEDDVQVTEAERLEV